MTKAADIKEPYAICQECGLQFNRKPQGRAPKYCSAACRQRAYQSRRERQTRALIAPFWGEDITERTAIQKLIRQEMRDTVTEELVTRVRSEVLDDEDLWDALRGEVVQGVIETLRAIINDPAERDRFEQLVRSAH